MFVCFFGLWFYPIYSTYEITRPHANSQTSALEKNNKNTDKIIPFSSPGQSFHLHSPLSHRVLPAAGRDHPPHLAGGAAPRQVCPLHHDPRHI